MIQNNIDRKCSSHTYCVKWFTIYTYSIYTSNLDCSSSLIVNHDFQRGKYTVTKINYIIIETNIAIMYEPIEVDNYCNILLETLSIDPKGVPSSSSEVEVGCTI